MRTSALRFFLLGLIVFWVVTALAADGPVASPAVMPDASRFLLSGKVAVGKEYIFSLRLNRPNAKSEWLALGQKIEGYTLAGYDHPSDVLTLQKGDETIRVPMEIATIKPSASPTDRRQRDLERMAAMKPALESGQPIKGDVLMLVNGAVRQQPIEFVMGREIRIDAGADGMYVILPELKPNGTVGYTISLVAKGPGDTAGEVKLKTQVIDVPWGGFHFATKDGRGFGFVPAVENPSLAR